MTDNRKHQEDSRPTWIEAARCLSQGEELAKGVSVEAHKRVLELDRLKYRSCFYQVLAEKPVAFFYGVSSAPSSLDDAARVSTALKESHGRHVTSTNHAIEEASIRAVWLNIRRYLASRVVQDSRGRRILSS